VIPKYSPVIAYRKLLGELSILRINPKIIYKQILAENYIILASQIRIVEKQPPEFEFHSRGGFVLAPIMARLIFTVFCVWKKTKVLRKI